jgi:hypothetical protein
MKRVTEENNDEHQYNETNGMHFSLSLLKMNGLYMFRALLARNM